MTRIALASLLALGFAAPAFAQGKTTKQTAPVTYQKTTVLKDFEDEKVGGTTVGPDGSAVSSAQRKTFPSFLKLRADFQAEMIKSSQDL